MLSSAALSTWGAFLAKEIKFLFLKSLKQAYFAAWLQRWIHTEVTYTGLCTVKLFLLKVSLQTAARTHVPSSQARTWAKSRDINEKPLATWWSFKASPNLYWLKIETKMSPKRPSLGIHKVPEPGNKKAKKLAQSPSSQDWISPAFTRTCASLAPQRVPGNHTGRHGRDARHRHRAACVILPHFNTSHLSCDTRDTRRGQLPGRQDGQLWGRRFAGDLDISQGHTASRAPGTLKSGRVRRPRPPKTTGSGSTVSGHLNFSAAGAGRTWKRSRTTASSPCPGRRRPGGAAGSSEPPCAPNGGGQTPRGEKTTLPPPPPPLPPSHLRLSGGGRGRCGHRPPMRSSAHPGAFPGAARLSPARGGEAAQHGGVCSRARLSRRSRGPPQPRGLSSAEPQVAHPAVTPVLRIRENTISQRWV